ncbi:MAG: glycosyltransferase [bacterium]|nr:glycosyltransferase [bacterium]
MEPRVTVLMPVYNGMPYLKEAIESVLKQTLVDFELLIMIDGSTDGSLECARSYNDSRIVIVCNENNLGTSDNMNKGIELARAPFVARLDQDDISLPKRFKEQLKFFETHPDIAIVCSWEYGIDSQGRKVRNWQGKIENYGAFLGPLVVSKCPIWHPSIMFRRQAMLEAGGYNKVYQPVEDFELTMRLALKGYRAAIVPKYLVMQRHHGNRQSVTKLEAQKKMTQRVHQEMLEKFCPIEDVESLGQFFRLEKEFWIYGKSKNHLVSTLMVLKKTLEKIRETYQLSDEEFISLVNIVYARLGCGAKLGIKFSFLPEKLFYLVFFFLSPFLFPPFRKFAVILYEFMRELRYPGRLLREGLEKRT